MLVRCRIHHVRFGLFSWYPLTCRALITMVFPGLRLPVSWRSLFLWFGAPCFGRSSLPYGADAHNRRFQDAPFFLPSWSHPRYHFILRGNLSGYVPVEHNRDGVSALRHRLSIRSVLPHRSRLDEGCPCDWITLQPSRGWKFLCKFRRRGKSSGSGLELKCFDQIHRTLEPDAY